MRSQKTNDTPTAGADEWSRGDAYCEPGQDDGSAPALYEENTDTVSPLLRAGQGRVSTDVWEAALTCGVCLAISLLVVLVSLILMKG